MESEEEEEKSSFAGDQREWLELVKTLVAMANARGGHVVLRNVTCDASLLDSARLDDRVNRYVGPRVRRIASEQHSDGSWHIHVGRYQEQPHMFQSEVSYTGSDGSVKSAFHPGQIYTRHSSKTEPATADDLRLAMQTLVADWMTKLGQGIQVLALNLTKEGSSLPVRLSDEEGALSISVADANQLYPYTARTLGEGIGKGQNWVAKAVERLALRGDTSYAWGAKGASGEVVVWKYSEAALAVLRSKLEDDAAYNPYRH